LGGFLQQKITEKVIIQDLNFPLLTLVIRGQKVMLDADMAKHTTVVHTLNR
jgi:hypothetical protein